MIEFSNDAVIVEENGNQIQILYIVLELWSNGELFEIIAEGGATTEEFARYLFRQIIDALEHMHTLGISHRDIKLENILLDSHNTLKLADFGFSSQKPINESFKGSQYYICPEIIKGIEYSGQSADIFAAGVVLFIMVAKHPPFTLATIKNANYNMLVTNKNMQFWKCHGKGKEGGENYFSEDFKDLVSLMLSPK